MEFQHRLEYISLKIGSTLSSARDADEILTELIRDRIREFLKRSLEKNDYRKSYGQSLSSALCFIGAIPDGRSKKLGEIGNEISEMQKISKDKLDQKFDHAIINIDCMSAIRLNHIMRILKKYDLERILDIINAECVEVKPIRRQNTTRP